MTKDSEREVLDLVATILRRLPDSLVKLRIDELVATHFVQELTAAGLVFDELAFLQAACVDEHFRSIVAKGAHSDSNPYSKYRRQLYDCTKCRAKYATLEAYESHKPTCKPIIPQIKNPGSPILDLNKLG